MPALPSDIIIQQSPASALCDSFGRLRTGDPKTLFYSSLTYGMAPQALVWGTSTTGTGSVADGTGFTALTTAATNDVAIFQTLGYHRYQPGKSQLVKITGAFGAAQTNVKKRMGYYDAANGIFLEQAADGTLSFNIRNASSDNTVNQADWNGDDYSSFDFTKALILLIDMEWLGAGSVRCGIVQDGTLKTLHTFHHAGIVSAPYMATATLPIRYEIIQSGAGSGAMRAICAAVDSEGGTDEEAGIPCTTGNDGTGVSVTTAQPVVALRPALTFNSKTNRRGIIIDSIDAYCTTNPALIQVIAHGAITGGAWAAVNSTYSSIEKNVTATSNTGGHILYSFYIAVSGIGASTRGSAKTGITSRVPIALDVAGTSQAKGLAIVATGIGGASVVSAQVNWREVS